MPEYASAPDERANMVPATKAGKRQGTILANGVVNR
jgi:hypothetical protein